jgi:hypothetical protein
MSSSPSGPFPVDVRAAAAHYLSCGRIPVPVPRAGRCKAPVLDGWQNLRPQPEELDRLFPSDQPLNVGLLLGGPSGGLVDVDLDCQQAVCAAPHLLPPTGWVSGREGKPRSHWWYVVGHPPDKAEDKYADLDGTDLLELRSTGGQTVVPPSVHETGQPVHWHAFEQPAQADLAALDAAVRALAASALLARHWPTKGSRQEAFLALVGALLRAGWEDRRAERFVQAVATATGDEEPRKRVQVVDQTRNKLDAGKPITGWPKLAKILGSEVVDRARTWLGLMPKPAAKLVRTPPPYQPFPVDALPAPLAEYVRMASVALGVDPAFVALPVLAVAASAIGNTRAIRLKRGWEEPCIIWTAIVGDSGTLKSPAYLKALAPLFRLQKHLLNEFKLRQQDYLQELEEYKPAKRKAKED